MCGEETFWPFSEDGQLRSKDVRADLYNSSVKFITFTYIPDPIKILNLFKLIQNT